MKSLEEFVARGRAAQAAVDEAIARAADQAEAAPDRSPTDEQREAVARAADRADLAIKAGRSRRGRRKP